MKSILTKIKRVFAPITPIPTKNTCYFCKRKRTDLRNYKNEKKRKSKCVIYVLNTLKGELIANKHLQVYL